jgi:hypothetical protein
VPEVDRASVGPDKLRLTGALSIETVLEGAEMTFAALLAPNVSVCCPFE